MNLSRIHRDTIGKRENNIGDVHNSGARPGRFVGVAGFFVFSQKLLLGYLRFGKG